jgi:O-antigen ligase
MQESTQSQLFNHPIAKVVPWAVLFLCLGVYAYTGSFIIAAVPFAFLFMLLMGVNWKTAYWVFLFTIPFSIDLNFFNDTLATSVPDEPIMWLLLLLLFVLAASRPALFQREWLTNPLVLIVAAQYLWLIIAVMYSHMPMLSIKFLVAKTWFLSAFFIFPMFIFKEKKDYRTGFLVMMIPILITILIVVYRHAMIGFNFRRIEIAIGDVYNNHVDYSTVMSMFYPLLWVAYLMTKGKGPFIRVPLLLIIALFLPAIYVTYARAAMLAVVFALGIAVAIRLKLAQWIMPVFYALIASLIIYMATDKKFMDFRPDYQHTFMRKKFTDHIVATFRGQDMSSMERLYRWIAGVRMSQDEPVKGFGPNTFYYYYKPYGVRSFKTYVSHNFEKSTTHNYYLYMLVEQGWPAMILYAIMVMVMIAQAQKTYHRFKDRFYKLCTMGVVMMFGAGFINNFFSELIETHKVGSLFYLSISLLVLLTAKSKQLEKEEKETAAITQ